MSQVIAVGVDVVEITRIEQALRRDRFLERCFTPGELAYATGSHAAERLAARFAAKEATCKALGVAGAPGRLKDIEVVRQAGGGVEIALSGTARERFAERGGRRLHLSFSHGREIAVAVVVLEG